jgi:hypothetical protein
VTRHITLEWDNAEKTVLRYCFQHGWNWDALELALKTSEQMLATVEHEVAVIMDFQQASLLPENALSHIFRAYERPNPPNLGVNIILAKTSLLKMMMETGRRALGKQENPWRLYYVQSEAEAYEIIEESQKK